MAYDFSIEALVDDVKAIRDDVTLEALNAPFIPSHRGDAKTLKEAAEFLLKDRTHSTREGGVVAWNVKAYAYSADRHNDEFKNDPALDKAWRAHFEASPTIYYSAIEQAQEHYRDEWTSYPGDDQGDWKFFFGGRSGGWLCLESWRGHDFSRMSACAYREFVAGLIADALEGEVGALQAFYNGLHTADAEFTQAAASENVAYYIADARSQWEESRKSIADIMAAAMVKAANDTAKTYGYTWSNEVVGVAAKVASHVITNYKESVQA